MPLEAPQLDDLTFDDLVRQARSRIQRYTPEWTDFNDSDPGMTLVQLFAWLTEMIGVRLNQVPERNYIKFLQLLNLEREPAQPATAHLTFTVKEDAKPIASVPERAQVAGQSDDGELIIFETSAGLDLMPFNLTAVQVNDGVAFRDLTTANEDRNTPYTPLGTTPQIGSAWYLGFGEEVKVDPKQSNKDVLANRNVAKSFSSAQLRIFLPEDKELSPVISIPASGPSLLLEQSERRGLFRSLKRLLEDPQIVSCPPGQRWENERRRIVRLLDQTVVPTQLVGDAISLLRDAELGTYPPPSRAWQLEKDELLKSMAQKGTTGSDVEPTPRLIWEYRSLEGPDGWTRLPVIDDQTDNLTTSGYIKLQAAHNIIPSREGQIRDRYFYWLRCRLVQGRYPAGTAPRIDFVRSNTVEALNLRTELEEELGDSNGEANQSFGFRNRPVQKDSLTYLIVEAPDGGRERWERVDDIHSAAQDQKAFQLNANAGTVVFGDGIRGRIPTAGSVITAESYRAGGGKQGNLPIGAVNTPLLNILGVDSVSNAALALGGKEEQPLDDLKRKAPGMLRRGGRAVLADDFANFAKSAGGVAEARAIPLAHPDHPGVPVPGSVSVVILPDNDDLPPRPSLQLLRSVATKLDEVRLITTELHVLPPTFYEIAVTTRIRARSSVSFGLLRDDINSAINSYLDPKKWGFGRDFYPTALYGEIQGIADVRAVESLSITVNGKSQYDLSQPVRIPPQGLVHGVRQHQIVVDSEIDF